MLRRQLLRYRWPAVIVSHLAVVALADYTAFWLRFDGIIPSAEFKKFLLGLPWLLAIRLILFYRFRLFEGLWRYTGLWDLRNLLLATGLGSTIFFLVVRFVLRIPGYPRSTYVLEALLVMFILGGMRLLARAYPQTLRRPEGKRVLIMGGGDAGAMIAREMKSMPLYGGIPVGFVDDDPAKKGLYIHGVRVYGGRDELATWMGKTHPDEVLIAMPSVSAAALRDVVTSLEPFALPLKTLPNLTALIHGKVSLDEIRPLAIEDLLERPPVGLDPGPMQDLIHDHRVLVTGAGGSIGSELCRQIARFGPSSLIMLDRYENGLFTIEQDVARLTPDFPSASVIADVTDATRLEHVFGEYRPEIVFHAAAHKHVPLMEGNPCEAVKNNVRGTRLVAEAALKHGVRRFVLISSDKAVNPSSVMGATKRVAERIMQAFGNRSDIIFAAVRFGNVLGSSGSVVPVFRQQIQNGGPVTVTHAEMRRYFMLIPEAVQLVLQAATIARGGEVFVLEMGKPVKVIDMARNLIRLSGSRPDRDVQITVTGVRPGEKLEEELVGADEELEPSGCPKILRVHSRQSLDGRQLTTLIPELERAALAGDVGATIATLREIVPTFTPMGLNAPQPSPESPPSSVPTREVV